MNRNYIIDIGASYLRFGVSSDTFNKPITIKETPKSKKEILLVLENEFKRLKSEMLVCNNSLVVSCAGMINKMGIVKESYYVDLKGVSLIKFFKSIYKEADSIIVENDANLQALGQYSGNNLLYIVLGSAVGGAYVDKHGLFKGQNGFAFELGKLPVMNSYVNGHNTIATLDEVISGLSLDKKFGSLWWKHTNDKNILDYIIYTGLCLATVIKYLIMILDPGEICICGHMCDIDEFKEAISNSLHIIGKKLYFISYKSNTWELVNNACIRLF